MTFFHVGTGVCPTGGPPAPGGSVSRTRAGHRWPAARENAPRTRTRTCSHGAPVPDRIPSRRPRGTPVTEEPSRGDPRTPTRTASGWPPDDRDGGVGLLQTAPTRRGRGSPAEPPKM